MPTILGALGTRVRLTGVAYGGGRYVVVGHPEDGAHLIWVSTDGEAWQAPPVTEGYGLDGVQLVEDRFVGWGIHIWSSQDAESWMQSRREDIYLRRELASPPDAGILEAWPESGIPQPINVLPAPEVELPSEGNIPESLDYSWSDGLDCTSARCVLLGKELYLVP